MTDRFAPRARRREVADEDSLLVRGHYDYADSYEIELAEGDMRTPQEVFRDAVGQGPSVLRPIVPIVHRQVLRFRLGALVSPNHLFGWRVVYSGPEVIHLEAAGPLMRGIIVGRRASPPTVVFTTFVVYVRPATARIIWALVGPLHRRIVPSFLELGARAELSVR
jgi:hypothetical protein